MDGRNALLGGGKRPAPRFDGVEPYSFTFKQHPAQHVLRQSVPGLRRRAIKLGGTHVILFDAFAFEIKRGQVSPAHGIAGLGGKHQPAQRQRGISLKTKSFGEAGADIVLGARDARLGKRPPRSRAPPDSRRAKLRHKLRPCQRRRPAGARYRRGSLCCQPDACSPPRSSTAKLAAKCRFVFEAAQVEDVRAVLDASDHRNGKLAQRSRDAVRDVGCSAFSDIGASHLS
jgi:hypothetical protein